MVLKKRILFLSFYYPPDLSAGSFRTGALVQVLKSKMPENAKLEVITTFPNRYNSFQKETQAFEQEERFTLRRIRLPNHNSGVFDQSKAFIAYLKEVLSITRGQEYDLVIATSSRLMTGVLGCWVAKKATAAFYLDLRDLFVDNLSFVLPRGSRYIGRWLLGLLERWCFLGANRINIVSPGFTSYIQNRYPNTSLSFFTNGIDSLFSDKTLLSYIDQKQPQEKERRLQVLYAGNIGAGQGLEHILPELASKLADNVIFTVIGDGSSRVVLEQALYDMEVDNVKLILPVSREELLRYYAKADVLFLHLNNLPPLESVLPSKLFEYAATGKPIWAGVSGFTADFIVKELDNAVVFSPCSAEAAKEVLYALDFKSKPRKSFVSRYRREKIMDAMADDVLRLLH